MQQIAHKGQKRQQRVNREPHGKTAASQCVHMNDIKVVRKRTKVPSTDIDRITPTPPFPPTNKNILEWFIVFSHIIHRRLKAL